jgi:ABC-type methionine transport system ATPase subunit
MDLVRRVCPRVIVMDTGRPLSAGVPDEVFADPKVITAYLGVSDEDELVPDALAGDDGDENALPATAVGAAPTTTGEDHHG